MKRFIKGAFAILALAYIGISQAQTFTCRDNTGRVYQSQRSCPSPGLIYYGPTERQSVGSGQYVPSVGLAPEHLTLMSPRCAPLHDAMRTAPARGLKHPEIADMRREYNRDCADDESAAREKLFAMRAEKRQDAKVADQAKQQAVQQARMSAEMCGELKRVIKNKKMRTDLTPGEIGDLQRTEENYKARCT